MSPSDAPTALDPGTRTAEVEGAPPPEASAWDDDRVGRLGAALVAAGNHAGLGLAVVRREPAAAARVVYVSDVGAEILGFPRAQILGRPATSFLTPTEQALYGAAADPPAAGDRPFPAPAFDTTILTPDGRHVLCEVTTAPVEDEGESLIVVFFRDISERQRAIEAVRQSEQRFRALIECARDAVWVSNSERLLYVNSASAQMLGYQNRDELLSKSPFEIVDREDHAAMRERIQAVMAGANLLPQEYRTRRRDGSVFVTEVQSMPIDWEGQNAILGFARDVTARKEMEAKLGQAERLAALGTLLAGIAHEMNNPLSYVLLGLEKAVDEVDALDGTPEKSAFLKEVLANVRQGVDRVAGIVRQLRTSAHPEGAGWVSFNLRDVLESALRVSGNEIRHRAELVTSFHDIPEIRGDPRRLEQVFLNLLINAAQALPEGRATNTIQVTAYARPAPENFAVVEIQDNGVGISPETLPRIFDPFFTTKPVGVGTGLGLSVCHGIVTAHGGTITVDSIVNVKTTFRVHLPLAPAATAAAIARSSGASSNPSGATTLAKQPWMRKVLVVDDEPSLGLMIRQLLQSRWSVDLAATGREALLKLAASAARGAEGYDAILCDLMMPEMTGMDLYATALDRYPELERRFVFMTGGAFTPLAANFLASLPGSQRLEKPFDVATLLATLSAAIEPP